MKNETNFKSLQWFWKYFEGSVHDLVALLQYLSTNSSFAELWEFDIVLLKFLE